MIRGTHAPAIVGNTMVWAFILATFLAGPDSYAADSEVDDPQIGVETRPEKHSTPTENPVLQQKRYQNAPESLKQILSQLDNLLGGDPTKLKAELDKLSDGDWNALLTSLSGATAAAPLSLQEDELFKRMQEDQRFSRLQPATALASQGTPKPPASPTQPDNVPPKQPVGPSPPYLAPKPETHADPSVITGILVPKPAGEPLESQSPTLPEEIAEEVPQIIEEGFDDDIFEKVEQITELEALSEMSDEDLEKEYERIQQQVLTLQRDAGARANQVEELAAAQLVYGTESLRRKIRLAEKDLAQSFGATPEVIQGLKDRVESLAALQSSQPSQSVQQELEGLKSEVAFLTQLADHANQAFTSLSEMRALIDVNGSVFEAFDRDALRTKLTQFSAANLAAFERLASGIVAAGKLEESKQHGYEGQELEARFERMNRAATAIFLIKEETSRRSILQMESPQRAAIFSEDDLLEHLTLAERHVQELEGQSGEVVGQRETTLDSYEAALDRALDYRSLVEARLAGDIFQRVRADPSRQLEITSFLKEPTDEQVKHLLSMNESERKTFFGDLPTADGVRLMHAVQEHTAQIEAQQDRYLARMGYSQAYINQLEDLESSQQRIDFLTLQKAEIKRELDGGVEQLAQVSGTRENYLKDKIEFLDAQIGWIQRGIHLGEENLLRQAQLSFSSTQFPDFTLAESLKQVEDEARRYTNLFGELTRAYFPKHLSDEIIQLNSEIVHAVDDRSLPELRSEVVSSDTPWQYVSPDTATVKRTDIALAENIADYSVLTAVDPTALRHHRIKEASEFGQQIIQTRLNDQAETYLRENPEMIQTLSDQIRGQHGTIRGQLDKDQRDFFDGFVAQIRFGEDPSEYSVQFKPNDEVTAQQWALSAGFSVNRGEGKHSGEMSLQGIKNTFRPPESAGEAIALYSTLRGATLQGDPKAGERTFEYAHDYRNPEASFAQVAPFKKPPSVGEKIVDGLIDSGLVLGSLVAPFAKRFFGKDPPTIEIPFRPSQVTHGPEDKPEDTPLLTKENAVKAGIIAGTVAVAFFTKNPGPVLRLIATSAVIGVGFSLTRHALLSADAFADNRPLPDYNPREAAQMALDFAAIAPFMEVPVVGAGLKLLFAGTIAHGAIQEYRRGNEITAIADGAMAILLLKPSAAKSSERSIAEISQVRPRPEGDILPAGETHGSGSETAELPSTQPTGPPPLELNPSTFDRAARRLPETMQQLSTLLNSDATTMKEVAKHIEPLLRQAEAQLSDMQQIIDTERVAIEESLLQGKKRPLTSEEQIRVREVLRERLKTHQSYQTLQSGVSEINQNLLEALPFGKLNLHSHAMGELQADIIPELIADGNLETTQTMIEALYEQLKGTPDDLRGVKLAPNLARRIEETRETLRHVTDPLERERIIKQALNDYFGATDRIPFEEPYHLIDAVVQKYIDPQSADKATPEYQHYYEAIVRELTDIGTKYTELSVSVNKLNKGRFTAEMVAQTDAKLRAEGLQPTQISFLAMVETRWLASDAVNEGVREAPGASKAEQQTWSETLAGLDAALRLPHVKGVDIASPEKYSWNKEGMNRLTQVYQLVDGIAKSRKEQLVLRPHGGEGYAAEDQLPGQYRRSDLKRDPATGVPRTTMRAEENLETLIGWLEKMQKDKQLDSRNVVVRIGHGTNLTEGQVERLATLGKREEVWVEINWGSNVATGSIQDNPITGATASEQHALLKMMYSGVKLTLNTDAAGVMATTPTSEYLAIDSVLQDFKAGKIKLKLDGRERSYQELVELEANLRTEGRLPAEYVSVSERFSLDRIIENETQYRAKVDMKTTAPEANTPADRSWSTPEAIADFFDGVGDKITDWWGSIFGPNGESPLLPEGSAEGPGQKRKLILPGDTPPVTEGSASPRLDADGMPLANPPHTPQPIVGPDGKPFREAASNPDKPSQGSGQSRQRSGITEFLQQWGGL